VTATSLKPGTLSGLTSADHLKASSSDNKETFSIGLGVLSPSYSQKFGEDGKTKLDFNSEQGGFSYSLTNVVHPAQSGPGSTVQVSTGNPTSKVQSEGFVPSSYYNAAPTQPQINIYHKQQSADPNAIYGRQIASQYPVAPAAPTAQPTAQPAAAPSPSITAAQAASYAAAQQAAFGYNPYQGPAPTAQAPSNALAAFPTFAAGLTDAEKSFLNTVPISPAQAPVQTAPVQAAPAPYPQAAYGYNPAAQSAYAQQAAAQTAYASQAAPQAAYGQAQSPYGYAGYQPQVSATSTQPKLVSQQQLTANVNPTSVVHSPPLAPMAPGQDPYHQMNPYMAAASMYNPAYSNLAASASSAYPSISPYDFLNDFMY